MVVVPGAISLVDDREGRSCAATGRVVPGAVSLVDDREGVGAVHEALAQGEGVGRLAWGSTRPGGGGAAAGGVGGAAGGWGEEEE
eukprot:183354-Rhodomonas_salina.1